MAPTSNDGSQPATPEEGAPRSSSLLRKSAIGLAGGGLIAAGVVMLVTPGPGLLTIAGGLAVLSKEFSAADKLVVRMRRETIGRIRNRRSVDDPTDSSGQGRSQTH